MTERPSGGKLISHKSVLRETPAAPMASIDSELRRIGEELLFGSKNNEYITLLLAIDEELQSGTARASSPEIARRMGICQILLGSAYNSVGQDEGSAAAFDRAISTLEEVGLEDLPAEALLPYADGLRRAHKLRRAADAIRQVARRGYGEKAGPLAVAVADELNSSGRPKQAAILLREFAEATSSFTVHDDQQLIEALERHGLPELAALRCLELGDQLDPSDGLYRDVYLRAVRLSAYEPHIVLESAQALAAVDLDAALRILDDSRGMPDDPAGVVLRAEILAQRGQVEEAVDLLDELNATNASIPGMAAARGLIAYLKDDFVSAVTDLLVAITENRNDKRSTLLLGDSVHRTQPHPAASEAAEDALHRLISRAGPDGWTLAVLALVQKARGNGAMGEATLNQAAELDDAPAWVYSEVGENRRRAGRFNDALDLFERAIVSDPRSAWAIGSRGQVRAALNDHAGAMRDYAEALLMEPELGWVFDSAIEIAHPASDEFRPIVEALQVAIDDSSLDPRVREAAARRIAFVWASGGESRQALAVLEQAGKYTSNSPALPLSMAWVRWRADDLAGARADLSRVARLDPTLGWVLEEPWTTAVATEPLRTALIDQLRTAASDSRLDVGARVTALLGAVDALAPGDDAQTRCELLEQALKLDDADPIVLTTYADTLLQSGRTNEAVKVYERASELRPDDSGIMVALGVARHRGGDLEGAARDLRQALYVGVADERWTSLELADVLARTSPPDARDVYRRLLRVEPADVAAARGLSDLYTVEGRTSEAMAVLQRTREYAADDAYLLSDIVLLAMQMDDIELALATADGLVARYPVSVVAAQTMGMVHNEFGEWQQALEAFDQVLELDPQRSEAHARRAWALEYQGQTQAAAKALEEALRYDDNPYFRREYALVLRTLGEERALSLLTEAVDSTPSENSRDASTMAHLGFCRVALGQFDRAADQLMEALDVDPTVVSTQLDLALALLAGGRSAASRGEYRRALARVARRHARKQVGLLKVAMVDLDALSRWCPGLSGVDESQRLIAESLDAAESAVSKLELQPQTLG